MTRAPVDVEIVDPRIHLGGGGIPLGEAKRQARTAGALLRRLTEYPGQVLADEVGMGKTFVALAVAATRAWADDQPVVVMVPPRLMDKWARDIARFRARCLRPGPGQTAEDLFRFREAGTGAEFLRCFDDPPERRAHLVLLANTALHRAERDPFVRLAAMRRALNRSNADETLRRAVARFAPQLLRDRRIHGLDEDDIETLLGRHPKTWLAYLHEIEYPIDDDPVPASFREALTPKDLDRIAESLRAVPRRASKNFEERIAWARRELGETLKSVWRHVLRRARIRSPLLVFDEAHHLKNPDTRLASLFIEPEAGDTSVISDAFDRMLFLTATPFQLGHHELLEVLRRFKAIRWPSMPPGRTVEALGAELDELGVALDRAQQEALHLDRLWGHLTHADVGLASGEAWAPGAWTALRVAASGDGPLGRVLPQYEATRESLGRAGSLLRPWVIRHMRSRTMPTDEGSVARRQRYTGRAIADGTSNDRGLEVVGEARFPFLLCARAQSLLGRQTRKRAYFSEGLASSFGAFLDTSKGARPTDDSDAALEGGVAEAGLEWYVESVEEFVRGTHGEVTHPKIEATVHRAVSHWLDGDKVLVFGHFRMTIRDLRDRIVQAVDEQVGRLAARALGLPAEREAEARDRVRRMIGRLSDRESPVRRGVERTLRRWVDEAEVLTGPQRSAVVEILLASLARDSVMVRAFPLDRPEVRASLEAQHPTALQARRAAEAVADALARRRGTSRSYRQRVGAFLEHLVGNLADEAERDDVLEDLGKLQIEVVRHADGGVLPETRRRVLRGFNSPLVPEILVASEVMAEGLDLHLDCRHVIHHDLSWNPSTLEQRTGRVDRLRCRAEADQASILVYLPYLEGTADEKMYRVVTDRARWFQVVMGERYAVDEASTEKLAARVPFPQDAASGLVFDLAVVRDGTDSERM